MGRRPGLKKWTPTQISSAANKILLLGECRYGLPTTACTWSLRQRRTVVWHDHVDGEGDRCHARVHHTALWSGVLGKMYICGQVSTNAIAVFNQVRAQAQPWNSCRPRPGSLNSATGTICCEWRGH